MSDYDSIRTGAAGNNRLLKSYGGGSTGPRQAYATGGMVKGSNPSLSEGLTAAGGAAKPSLARPGRKMASKGKSKDKKGTQVNVVIAQAPPTEKPEGPMPMMPPMGGPPPGPPPMPPPPMAGPPGPGGPMPPMRAFGGPVAKKDEAVKIAKREERSVGGPASPPRGFDAGAGGARGRLEKIKEYGK